MLDGESDASLVLVLLMLVPLPGEDEGLLAGLEAVVSYPGLDIPGLIPGPGHLVTTAPQVSLLLLSISGVMHESKQGQCTLESCYRYTKLPSSNSLQFIVYIYLFPHISNF